MRFALFLEEITKEDFWELANLQRGVPEAAMRQVQKTMGGGVINAVVEHVGDLIHRMTERNTFGYAGYDYVKNKVEKVLGWLKSRYGFEREFGENIRSAARYFGITEDEMRERVYRALDEYANEHAKLPTYNRAQKLAQLAAVAVGRRDFKKAIWCLESLRSHMGTMDQWIEFAHQGLISSS